MGMPREPTVFNEVNKVCDCKDVLVTPGGCSWLHGAVSISKKESDDGKKAIEAAFKRLGEGAGYIQETKEAFKRNYMVGKKKINQSHLAEFLYNHVVDNIHVTAEQKAVLRKDPLKMDEYVRRGIVKKEEYMYYTLLNFVVRYYLEHEVK